jgi:hypothetical protein
MDAYLWRTEGISVSWHYVAKLWRDNDLKPHRTGTFKLFKDPRFRLEVADVVGLYLTHRPGRWCSRSTEDAGADAGPHPANAAGRLLGQRETTTGMAPPTCSPP